MSSRDPSRRAALAGGLAAGLAGALALAGCGFTPVYGPGGTGAALNGQVLPDQPESQDDFHFARRLGEVLGHAGDARYRLAYRLQIAVLPQGITPDQITTRYSLNGTASYALTDQAGNEITRGQVSNFTSYSAIGTTVATLAGEADARRRLATMLADQVVTRLYATMPEAAR